MKLTHYSRSAQIHIRFYRQQVRWRARLIKPRGLWVSCDDFPMNWKEWCEAERFRLDDLKYVHRVYLKPVSNILFLKTQKELIEFTQEYLLREDGQPFARFNFYLDWKRVAKEYPGIIIAPYRWDCRMDYMWYYGWDCASGCIWNPDAIEAIRRQRSGGNQNGNG